MGKTFSFSASDFDIIDEAIYYFKANIFFRNYEIKVSYLHVKHSIFQTDRLEQTSLMRVSILLDGTFTLNFCVVMIYHCTPLISYVS